MRVVSIIAAVALLVLSALSLWPAAAAYDEYLPIASLAMAGILLVSLLAGGGGKKAEPARHEAEAAKPALAPSVENRADAEVVSFLALFQERGRFIDFLMEDITGYTDAQVGTAARVVHEGCRAALQEHFRIRPVREENEGSRVSVAAGYAADEYRFIGRLAGEPPFSGVLVHRGWMTERVELPRLLRREGDRLPTIAPAEVELN